MFQSRLVHSSSYSPYSLALNTTTAFLQGGFSNRKISTTFVYHDNSQHEITVFFVCFLNI